MQNADMLLLVIPDVKNNEGILTGKLFEYLATQKPILCLGPVNGNAAKIIKECKAGETINPKDLLSITQSINKSLIPWPNDSSVEMSNDSIKNYSRKGLTRKLVEIIGEE
jgi:hypothetical protein